MTKAPAVLLNLMPAIRVLAGRLFVFVDPVEPSNTRLSPAVGEAPPQLAAVDQLASAPAPFQVRVFPEIKPVVPSVSCARSRLTLPFQNRLNLPAVSESFCSGPRSGP